MSIVLSVILKRNRASAATRERRGRRAAHTFDRRASNESYRIVFC